MGSADIVPGVSGGTIALITGIYGHLVEAISKIRFAFIKPLIKGDINGFINGIFEEIDFKFFIPLRQLGSYFHIAMNGIAASDKIF